MTEAGRRLALLVAVADYEDHRLPPLPSVMDLEGLHGVLSDPSLGDFECERLVDPTAAQLAKAIRSLFGERSAVDTTLFYFSGHGMKDRDGTFYLLTSDTDRDVLAGTALGSPFLAAEIDDSWARAKMVMLDCCFSGAFVPGVGRKADIAMEGDQFGGGRGCVIMTSSDSLSPSFHEGGKSVFTSAVVEGIRTGRADRDGDGLIDTMDLLAHVRDRAAQASVEQTPRRWAFDLASDLVVARAPVEAHQTTIDASSDAGRPLETPTPEVTGPRRWHAAVLLPAVLALVVATFWLVTRSADDDADLGTTPSTAQPGDQSTTAPDRATATTSGSVDEAPGGDHANLESVGVIARYRTGLSSGAYLAAGRDWIWSASGAAIHGFRRDDPLVSIELTLDESGEASTRSITISDGGTAWIGAGETLVRVVPSAGNRETDVERFDVDGSDVVSGPDGQVHAVEGGVQWFDENHAPVSEIFEVDGSVSFIQPRPGGAWVLHRGRSVARIELEAGTVDEVAELLPESAASFLATDGSTLWAPHNGEVAIQQIDPDRGTAVIAFRFAEVEQIAARASSDENIAEGLTVEDASCKAANVEYSLGLVWATWCGIPYVVVQDPDSGSTRAIATSSNARDLAVAPDGGVWVALLDGSILELGRT